MTTPLDFYTQRFATVSDNAWVHVTPFGATQPQPDLMRSFNVADEDEIAAMVEYAISLNGDTRAVYVTGHLQTEQWSGGRTNSDDFLAVTALTWDADARFGIHKGDDSRLLLDLDDLRRVLDMFPLPPSAVVHSGGGFYPEWWLTEPAYGWTGQEILDRFGATSLRIFEEADRHLDSTFDNARIFRFVGTQNRKGEPVEVKVLFTDPGRRYTFDQLDAALDAPLPPPVRKQIDRNEGDSLPGDDYNTEATVDTLVSLAESHGFHSARTMRNGRVNLWRPSKTRKDGTHALTVYPDDGRGFPTVCAYSEAPEIGNLGLKPGHGYDPIGFYVRIHHNGSWETAMSKLNPTTQVGMSITVTVPVELEDIEPSHQVGDVKAFTADSLKEWSETPIEWRIPRTIVKGTYGLVGGPKKALKSTLFSGEFAVSLANGIPWLDSPELPVEKSASVIVVVNEGLRSYMRSLSRIAKARGLDSYGDILVIPANGIRAGNEDLTEIIKQKAETSDDLVLIFDATYGFVGGDAKAENLFAMADVLGIMQNLGEQVDADVWLVHHYRKNTTGFPDLDDLSWAGFGEWADSWLLLTHREPAEADKGLFKLGLVAGSREGFETCFEIDADLGVMNELGYHDHPPQFTANRIPTIEAHEWGKRNQRNADLRRAQSEKAIIEIVTDQPYDYVKTEILKLVGGSDSEVRKVFDRLTDEDRIVSAKVQKVNSRGHLRPTTCWAVAGIEPPPETLI